MSRTGKVVVGVAAFVLLAGVGVWYVVLRDDAPPAADLSVLDDELDTASTDGSAPPRSGIDGEWQVAVADEAFAGYRIEELYGPGTTLKTTVTGRTGEVTGALTIDGTSIPAAQIEVDTTTLESDRSRRDETLKIRGLETETFPTATFELTDPIELDALPAEGEEVEVTAVGDLTMHGVTDSVEVDLTAKWSGDRISIDGSIPIVLADYDIEAISIPQFVAIDDHGTLEFVLLFEPA